MNPSQHYWLFLSIASPHFRLKIGDNTFISFGESLFLFAILGGDHGFEHIPGKTIQFESLEGYL